MSLTCNMGSKKIYKIITTSLKGQWVIAVLGVLGRKGDNFEGFFICIIPPDIHHSHAALYTNVWILIKISLKFVLKGPISSIAVLVQRMAWRRPGDTTLSEAMVVRYLTHICVTWPQWVNSLCHSDANCQCRYVSTWAQVMARFLTAPSHYLKQVHKILKLMMEFERNTFKNKSISHGYKDFKHIFYSGITPMFSVQWKLLLHQCSICFLVQSSSYLCISSCSRLTYWYRQEKCVPLVQST